MKHTLWTVALVMMFVGTHGAAQEAARGDKDAPTLDEMERYQKGLELKAREAQLLHEQKLRELESKQREAELTHAREMRGLELAEREADLERKRRSHDRPGHKHGGGLFLLLILLANILLTVWVFKDMHEQKIGRALWVPIVLLTGIFGAILYAVVRNADLRPKPAQGPGAGQPPSDA